MKQIIFYILVFTSLSVYSKLPEIETSILLKNSIKSVTEWKYVLDSNGMKHEPTKTMRMIYNRKGNPVELIDFEGLYTIREEKAVYQYDSSGNLESWKYLIDTNIIKEATYDYDSLSRIVKEERNDKYDSFPKVIDYLYHEIDTSKTRKVISTCDLCYINKTIEIFDENDKIISETTYQKNGLKISEKVFSYNTSGRLVKIVTKGEIGCEQCNDNFIIYQYNNNQQLSSEIHYIEGSIVERKLTFEYNDFKLITQTLLTIRGNNITLVSRYEYEYFEL
ncbi:MAG: hypothetical protein CVV25_12210 [Ignavibacteriae bacterium HGW-Ignavibacteriae-4]|jgi:hypothetical protein|nr:MAG: hypothetical protein CVV25_12210 [Ignavibacteriae bacterium HGW-Ignavibacteriae-4]